MVKWRQTIRPGDRGRDVRAVKRTLVRMHAQDSGQLGDTNFAGNAFVRVIRHVQFHHGLKVDGIYGAATHKIVAPHFRAYDRWLYRTAKKRNHEPPAPSGTTQSNAQRLLQYHTQGKLRDDSGACMWQIRAAAKGEGVWSPLGYYVHFDKQVFQALEFLIEKGLRVGIFALCSNHGNDGTLGHAGGHAVDISSINGVSVAAHTFAAKENTLKAMALLNHGMPATLRPWQLICDGYGYIHEETISKQCIPSAAFYGYPTLAEHRNHIHLGYR